MGIWRNSWNTYVDKGHNANPIIEEIKTILFVEKPGRLIIIFLYKYFFTYNLSSNDITFPGIPTTSALSGMSVVTTVPAPIITLFPILIYPITVTLLYNTTLFPIIGIQGFHLL